jgi:hypothetical protein
LDKSGRFAQVIGSKKALVGYFVLHLFVSPSDMERNMDAIAT